MLKGLQKNCSHRITLSVICTEHLQPLNQASGAEVLQHGTQLLQVLETWQYRTQRWDTHRPSIYYLFIPLEMWVCVCCSRIGPVTCWLRFGSYLRWHCVCVCMCFIHTYVSVCLMWLWEGQIREYDVTWERRQCVTKSVHYIKMQAKVPTPDSFWCGALLLKPPATQTTAWQQ